MKVRLPTPHISAPREITKSPVLPRPSTHRIGIRGWDDQRARSFLLWLASAGFPASAAFSARHHRVPFASETLRRYRNGTGPLATFAWLLLSPPPPREVESTESSPEGPDAWDAACADEWELALGG